MKHNLVIFLGLFPLLLAAQQKTEKHYGFHTFLGVDVDNTSEKTGGLFVNGVYRGYGAEKAGIQRGDILMSINSTNVHSFGELVNTLDKYKGGENVNVSVMRSTASRNLGGAPSR